VENEGILLPPELGKVNRDVMWGLCKAALEKRAMGPLHME
jgi:hypothetical protein